MRSLARKTVFQYVFSTLFNLNDEGLFAVLKKDAKLSEKDLAFADELLSAVEKRKQEYSDIIDELTKKQGITKIFKADKVAIMIGMAELSALDTPKLVAIDEAVKLAAEYSTEKSTDFVNGVLASYLQMTEKN